MRSNENQKPRSAVFITAYVFYLLIVCGVIEGSARIIYSYQSKLVELKQLVLVDRIKESLDPFEIEDPQRVGHWKLKPGYETTYAQYMLDKDSKAKGIPRVLATDIPAGSEGAKTFRVNSQGFKGHELTEEKKSVRVLMLGDSVTFGLLTDDYPSYAASYFEQNSLDVEVINGGVEGYSIQNLEYEMERYTSISPDIVTIYIGWNNLFSPREWLGEWEWRFRFLWLTRELFRSIKVITGNPQENSISLRDKTLNPHKENFEWVGSYVPLAIDALRKLVKKFQKADIRPVLITLPGLYDEKSQISPQMLKIGHLPEYTDNPYLFAKATERYNAEIRKMAHELGVPLIDLSSWATKTLSNKITYFSDSVHLTPAGLHLVGREIAENLVPIIKNIQK